MIRRFGKLGCLLGVLGLLCGCEHEIQESLQQRIDERAAKGQEKVLGILGVRDEGIRTSLESTMADMQEARDVLAAIKDATEIIRKEYEAEYSKPGSTDGEPPAVRMEDGLKRVAVKRLRDRFARMPETDEIEEEEQTLLTFLLENHPDRSAIHPLVTWRKGVKSNAVSALETEVNRYPGTHLETDIPEYITFLQNQSEYWSGDARDMQINAPDYVPFLREYAADNTGSPMYDDAMFDLAFIHAQHGFYSKRKAIRVDEWLTFHTKYFQLLFEVPRVPREGFESYVERVCRGYALEERVGALMGALKAELHRMPSTQEMLQTMQTAIVVQNTDKTESAKVRVVFPDKAQVAGGNEPVVEAGQTLILRGIGGTSESEKETAEGTVVAMKFPRPYHLTALSGDGIIVHQFELRSQAVAVPSGSKVTLQLPGPHLDLADTDLMAAEGLVRSACSIPGEKNEKTQCLNMPSEYRALAVAGAYYDGVVCRFKKIDEKLKETPYRSALFYLKKQLGLYRPQTDNLEEYPVVPDIFSFDPAKKKLVLEMGKKGVFFGENQRNRMSLPVDSVLSKTADAAMSSVSFETLLNPGDEEYSLSSRDTAGLRAKMLDSLDKNRNSGGQEYIGVNVDESWNAFDVLDVVTAPQDLPWTKFKSVLNQEIWIAGRHRVTHKNQLKSLQLRFPLTRAHLAAQSKGDGATPVEKGVDPLAHLTRLSIKTPKGTRQCSVVGYTGGAVVGEFLPATGAAILKGDKSVTWGSFPGVSKDTPDAAPATTMTSPTTKTTEEVDWKDLSDWVSDRNDAVVFGIDKNTSWNLMVKALSAMAYKCTEQGCRKSDPYDGPNVYLAKCY